MTVADVHDRNATSEIDVFSAVDIFYNRPFGGFNIQGRYTCDAIRYKSVSLLTQDFSLCLKAHGFSPVLQTF
jgi:hypothetical protein